MSLVYRAQILEMFVLAPKILLFLILHAIHLVLPGR